MLRQALAKAQDSIFGLVIQDHIESIGKPILLKGDEVMMMIWLLKCLVIHLLNYQQLSLPYTLISSLGPTDMPNPVTPRWTTSAISQTLVNSDFPILNSVSPKHELPTFCYLLSSNRCHRDDEVGQTETGMLLSLHESDKPRLYIRSHRNS